MSHGLLPAGLRDDFPLLINHPELHYLDNAATTQKPAVMLDAMDDCYRHYYAPVHRGLYPLAEESTQRYESARQTVAGFVGTESVEQLVFTHSATEAINMVAQAWARPRLQAGDRVWVTALEHHSNFLPWQRVCQQTGAELCVIDIHDDGSLAIDEAEGLFDARSRIIALCQVSNVLGVENPLDKIIGPAHQAGIAVLVDAAQSVGHQAVDVTILDCDFFVFSAHKMLGPNGIGALVIRRDHLDEMEPWLVGGGMVDEVTQTAFTPADFPARFEAGSPNLPAAVGFAAAVDYLEGIGMDMIQAHVHRLAAQARTALADVQGLTLLPIDPVHAVSIVSFIMDNIHPHDVAQVLGDGGVAARAGHHCCQPLMRRLGIAATTRVSFTLYNNERDIGALMAGIDEVKRLFCRRS